MDHLQVGHRRFQVARAVPADVPSLAGLLADDALGASRESADMAPYMAAFREIDSDSRQLLIVIRDDADCIVGTMQLTLVPGLARAGAMRLLIEGVRLATSTRGSGLGTAMFTWAHAYGRANGASLAQLTSDKSRHDAHRFYDRMGYVASHEGFKLAL